MSVLRISILALAIALLGGLPALADGEPVAGSWASLASDRVARKVGDTLTVIVNENSTATGTSQNSVTKNTDLQGGISAGNPAVAGSGLNGSANLGISSNGDNTGSTSRAGTMVAEISVAVDTVLPNGDLHVTGVRTISINGEQTKISVSGRVRLADISASNTVLSADLADATIKYTGNGFVTDSSRPGLITSALNWLGL